MQTHFSPWDAVFHTCISSQSEVFPVAAQTQSIWNSVNVVRAHIFKDWLCVCKNTGKC